MNETNNLVYFLNSIKDLLPFEDEQDFINVYSLDEINALKKSLNIKINKIQERIEPLEICRNHTFVLGSLEYINIVMKIERIEIAYKKRFNKINKLLCE